MFKIAIELIEQKQILTVTSAVYHKETIYKKVYLSQNGSARKHPFPISTQLGSIK